MSSLGNYLRDIRGNTAMLLGLAAIPILLGAGVAIDMSRAVYVRTVLQGAADAAALAGGTSKFTTQSELNSIVHNYLLTNSAETVLDNVTSMSQEMDRKKGTFTVTIKGDIKTGLTAVAGFDKMDISVTSEVNIGAQALELALVLDNTGSMSGSKIANLISAANNLVNIIDQEKSDYSTVTIGVVPFAEYVNVGLNNSAASWLNLPIASAASWRGCVGSRNAPDDLAISGAAQYSAVINEPCNAAIQPLTTDFDAVHAKISQMVATGSTYIPAGLLWGWNVLDSAAPFTEAKTKGAMIDAQGRKVLVLMTDGENTISPTYPTHNGNDAAQSNQNLQNLCQNVKADGVEIYTVSFMVPSATIKNILENCATNASKYFDAVNAAQLYAAFQKIGQELSLARLSR